MKKPFIIFFDKLSVKDISLVGGKNASLGEMTCNLKKKGINVPEGFATTSVAYWDFLEKNHLKEKICFVLSDYKKKKISLQKAGEKIRFLFLKTSFSLQLEKEIKRGYKNLCRRYKAHNIDVAVRSSATAEDLPEASFAGQQESFLNIRGEKALLLSCKKCYASLFTDRAISYREEKGFDHLQVALSIGIQKMVRSDKAGSGVMFTLDTESGFRNIVEINSAWGLGENIVQGTVIPDEYMVFKPFLGKKGIEPIVEKTLGEKEKKMVYGKEKTTINLNTSLKERHTFVLTNKEILILASWACLIENHYKKPMDIEWAKDGKTKKLFIVQARPETVESQKKSTAFKTYTLKGKGKKILEGLAVGSAVATGKVQIITDIKDIKKFKAGSILVTKTTAPDWVPIMKIASGIITDHGGRTSHAAIVSRELDVPAIVGTNAATKILKEGQKITLSCAEGDHGFVYNDFLEYKENEIDLKKLPKIQTHIMMNISSPAAAFRWWHLPCKGIGLARMEFIINNIIKIHPMALVYFDKIKDKDTRKKIESLTQGYPNKKEYFIDQLARSIGKIACPQYPHPVIVRMSDFKTNEYADLIGGKQFEPKEDNPMLGFRGASRYYNPLYRDGFALECQAIKRARNILGLKNIIIMIPFCRTVGEADKVLKVLKENGLQRGKERLKIYVMCEIPSNVILADEFAKHFDGFSIGSNDLTQLVLGVDRDSEELSPLFDARNPAVVKLIQQVIRKAHKKKRKVGICGQAPSDYPDFAQFLVKEKIDTISLNPDSVIEITKKIAAIEKRKR